MYIKSLIVGFNNGIHIRVAAEIVQKADEIKNKYGSNLYIRKMDANEPLAISMLALLSLRIKQGEKLEMSSREDTEASKKAVEEICEFIAHGIDDKNANLKKIDDIIEENSIANEQILESIPVGILVIDLNSYITSINTYGLKLIDRKLEDVLGRNVMEIIPSSDLPAVIKLKNKQSGKIQLINNHTVIVNRSQILSGKKIIGAIGVFQDISELMEMKELNEKLQKILETSHELICFVDQDRKVSYINPAYEKAYSISSKDVVGKDILELSPNGLRIQVFNTKEKIENRVYKKEMIDIVTTIEPLFIDNVFRGVLSISKPVSEIEQLMDKLEQSEERVNYYKEELERYTLSTTSFKNIIGASSSLRESLFIAERAMHSTSTVIVRGESGTGKELIAEAIHNNSPRKKNPFVRVNCAAIPENLLESELFGYEKGAFTGAVKKKPGKFNIADTGTIFLDEIGDMPKSMQVKLLRVLQEKEFESIGGLETQKVDVRVISATNRNLEEMMKAGDFREDLYYRLNVMTISLPPLRDRKADISLLVEHFVEKLSKKLDKPIKGIQKECLGYLQDYNWPGNIRELENIIERAINLCDDEEITTNDLPFYLTNITHKKEGLINFNNGDVQNMEAYEKEIIYMAMKKYKSFNRAGKALGLTHRTVSLKCKKYNIEV